MVKPLLARHDDLALVRRFILVKPVHHFSRAILIDRTSSSDQFKPRWSVAHLFEADYRFGLDWGDELYSKWTKTPGIWEQSDPNMAADLFHQIENDVLAKLRAMQTLDDYLAFVSQHRFRHRMYDNPTVRIIVETALGNLDVARTIADANLAQWPIQSRYADEVRRAKYPRLRQLCIALANDDRRELARLLHEWEAYTVAKLKIEHLWQPTPFPLELQGADR